MAFKAWPRFCTLVKLAGGSFVLRPAHEGTWMASLSLQACQKAWRTDFVVQSRHSKEQVCRCAPCGT